MEPPKDILNPDRALGSGAMQGVDGALALRSTDAAPRPAVAVQRHGPLEAPNKAAGGPAAPDEVVRLACRGRQAVSKVQQGLLGPVAPVRFVVPLTVQGHVIAALHRRGACEPAC